MQLQQGFVTRGTGFSDRFALQKFRLANVRFGSLAELQSVRPMSALPPKAGIGGAQVSSSFAKLASQTLRCEFRCELRTDGLDRIGHTRRAGLLPGPLW